MMIVMADLAISRPVIGKGVQACVVILWTVKHK